MADLINTTDTLNSGRLKINKGIESSERAEQKATEIAEEVENAAKGGWLGIGAVSPEKTTFLSEGSKNLFNKDKATKGAYIHSTTGSLTNSPLFYYSEYIPVIPNTNYVKKGTYSYAFYDSNKVFISGANSGTVLNAPENAAFLRISSYATTESAGAVPGIDEEQLELGTISTPYQRFVFKLENTKIEDYLFEDQFKQQRVEYEQLEGYEVGKNLFNKSKATQGGSINNVSGTIRANPDFYYSEYIPVIPNTNYVKKGTYSYAFYDSNKVFISGANSGTVLNAPENAFFVRISTYKEVFSGTAGINEEQLELGTISTPYESPSFRLPSLKVTNAQIVDSTAISVIPINLPSKIYGLIDQELNVYFDNILNQKDTNFEYDVICTIGGQYENYYRVTPTIAGTTDFTLIVYKDDEEVGRANSSIVVKPKTVGNAVTKKILIIGDSTTDNDWLVSSINENFKDDGMNVVALGTRGTDGNKHEGRAGWTTAMFMGRNSSFVSPFIFDGIFNFSKYISSNSLSTPDYVIINLGINDLFNVSSDIVLENLISTTITDYNTMIASIKTQNSNVKIAIALTIPPNYSQNAFGVNYGSGQTRKRYKQNNFLWVKKLIETFSNRESENIYLLPIHLNLDTRNNFGVELKKINARNETLIDYPVAVAGVHPVKSGYWQIADSYWYFLKAQEI